MNDQNPNATYNAASKGTVKEDGYRHFTVNAALLREEMLAALVAAVELWNAEAPTPASSSTLLRAAGMGTFLWFHTVSDADAAK